jgi:alcohol dehydrogenase class IV
MLFPFTFELPKGIFFGPKSRRNLPEIMNHLGKTVLVLIGANWFEVSGWKKTFQKLLTDYRVSFMNCPPGEPTVYSVKNVRQRAKELDPDVIVGIGGGSVLDTAKAVAGLLPVDDPVEDYLEGVGAGKTVSSPGIPWIAVPTTSGTGTEVTKNAVIKSSEMEVKKSIRSSHLIATFAIIDPELTLVLPETITGLSGMDALSQLIEAFVSKRSRPMPRALVKDAFPLMLSALKKLVREPRDLQARTDAAYGALISGIALANSGLGAAHGFASGIGGLFDVPHGLICAVFLAPVLRFNASVIRDQITDLVETGDLDVKGDALDWLVKEIQELLKLFDLERVFKAYGIPASRTAEIAEKSKGSSMSGNPIELTQKDKENLLLSVL